MAQGKEATTERLISIIQTIQQQRMSGTLTARRGEGITHEEGNIAFVKGQVTQTKAGRRNGSEAFNWLSTWRECRYTFVSSTSEENLPISSLPQTLPMEPRSSSVSSVRPKRPPLEQPLSPTRQVESFTERQTEPLLSRSPSDTPVTSLPSSALTTTIPYRIRPVEVALRLLEEKGLSRTHRHLFLLIDGQRTVLELVRLLKRGEQEVLGLLEDMKRVKIVQFVSSPEDK